jgi:hypothetical protein
MVGTIYDPRIAHVIENIEAMVASEGGRIELVDLTNTFLMLRYRPGVNHAYPECVPTHDAVRRFLGLSLRVNAPHITDFEVL